MMHNEVIVDVFPSVKINTPIQFTNDPYTHSIVHSITDGGVVEVDGKKYLLQTHEGTDWYEDGSGNPWTTRYLMPIRRVLLVGRHASEPMPGVEVVATKNVEWPTTGTLVVKMRLRALIEEARELGEDVYVLFQNAPAVLYPALKTMEPFKHGVIVSEPGPRLAGVEKRVRVCARDPETGAELYNFADEIEAIVKHANGRAKVVRDGDELVVTVDPVAPFKFVRVDWVEAK